MWMVEDGVSKNQNQRKRRQERESCINNVKIGSRRTSRQLDNGTYIRRPREKLQRSSLENVSTNPWGEPRSDEQSSLRRTRSLAITREDIFTNLEIQSNTPRRSQLIPRAKLIDRGTARDQRYGLRGSSAENLQDRATSLRREVSITPPDYSPPSTRNNRKAEAVYSSISNLASPKFLIGKEQDGYAPQYHNKSTLNSTYGQSYEELPGLSLPNYYPDSKYDTDNTDAISLADDLSTDGDNSKKYSSCDNLSTGKWTVNESDSIPYDDNIVLSTNRPLYDSIRENHYAKPRTIRGPTPYNNEQQVYYNREKKRSFSSNSSDDNKDNDKISLEHFQTDSNLDEIKLNNDNITKIIEVEEERIYETTENIEAEVIEEEKKESRTLEAVKTNIEIDPPQQEIEEYKTVVEVDPDLTKQEIEAEENKHSHNYLREFLESQKGSKKPLQNFITKKFSNLSRKSSNLIDNRFYSLPDLAVSKNLKKCEKIDRKLRKCDKTSIKKAAENTESRFIVNIGKHFDITANTNIPVDFELKIAKVPRKNKSKKNKNKPEDQFLEAVKNLKETLQINGNLDENQNITKPEIVAVKTKQYDMNEDCAKEYQEKLGTMRNYWDKMLNGSNNKKSESLEGSLTKCKIVDVQTKIEDVKKKFEPSEEKEPEKPSKVQMAKQLFEKKPIEKTEKLSPFIKETCNYFENAKKENQYESLNPNIVEIVSKDENKDKSKHKTISKSKSITSPEFDHVRYRVVKSDLFQKKIFANCEKESQFDGLMQYLQDYSFQELLRDNNIVIIEPIRTKVHHETSNRNIKTAKNITPLLHKHIKDENENSGLKRHFFYHPIRVNKEVNDDELPNPDTVKQVRQFFEGGLKRSQSSQEFEAVNMQCTSKAVLDPDKDHCSTDSNSNSSNMSDFGSQENLYDSITEHCCERQYVSEDVLEKIRECGTTITYYGGTVVKKQSGQPVLTKAIMEEIKNDEMRSGECNCRKMSDKDGYQGVRFKLIKSNSCNSRLELVGTNDLKESKEKYLKNKQKQLNNVKEIKELENKQVDKNTINENIKKNMEDTQPKIIGEERKMTQWGEMTKEKTYNKISFNNKSRSKIVYDYHNYDNLKTHTKRLDDMEFEPYEVA